MMEVEVMKEIRLNKLSLRDFQGGTFTLAANGKDVFIFAANSVGKTRLVSAFTWLLFNKDALGRADFEIKNLDAQGEAEHGLEHTVEVELDLDGEVTTLKKVFKEKWTKKRGNAEREFSGHTTDFYVNGVPLQEKLYIQHITDIAGDESRFRLLTSPTTFPQLHWQKQRQLLLDICGDISDENVISSNEKLSPLLKILGKHTLDDHRKIVTARRSEINKEMEKIPIRIDEVRRGIPDVTGIDRGKAEKEIQHFETALNDAKLRLQGVNAGGNIADLTKKISEINADLRKLEDTHRSESLSTLNRLNQQISEIGVQVGASRRRAQAIDGELKEKDRSLQSTDFNLEDLRKKWTSKDAEAFRDTIMDTCPSCGQALPSDRVQEARDKALASFNMAKADVLGGIDRQGQLLKEQRDRFRGEIDALQKEKEILVTTIPDRELHLKNLTDDRDTLKASSEDFSGIQNRADILDEIEDLEAQIKAEREGKAQDIEKIKGEIKVLEQEYFGVRMIVDRFRTREQGEKRIEELKAEEKKLAAEFEKLEGELYLIEQFIKTKVSLLTDRINAKFETVRFKLFNQLINGGLEECCEITVGGIPYNGGLNNGARINAGLEIVKVLQQHYGLKAPVFADNAEAVNNLVDVGCQMIRLYVSEDKTLRVEMAGEAAKAGNTEIRSRSSRRSLTPS